MTDEHVLTKKEVVGKLRSMNITTVRVLFRCEIDKKGKAVGGKVVKGKVTGLGDRNKFATITIPAEETDGLKRNVRRRPYCFISLLTSI